MKNRLYDISRVIVFLIVIVTVGIIVIVESNFVAKNDKEDTLIGVFISYEMMNEVRKEEVSKVGDISFKTVSLDKHSTMNFNMTGENIQESHSKKGESILYARKEIEEIVLDNGEIDTTFNVTFEDMEGLGFLMDFLSEDLYQASFRILSFDGKPVDVDVNIKGGIQEEVRELIGKIYIPSTSMGQVITANPVYLQKDGLIYMKQGRSLIASGERVSGTAFVDRLFDENTLRVDGEKKSFQTEIHIEYTIVDPTKKISVIQMDKGNIILTKSDFTPETMVKELQVDTMTDYLIIETTRENSKGELKVDKEMYTKEDRTFSYIKNMNSNILVKEKVEILWMEQK